jgi:hypothetical protein
MRLEMEMVMSSMIVVRSKGIVRSYSRKKRYGDAPAHLMVKWWKELAGWSLK